MVIVVDIRSFATESHGNLKLRLLSDDGEVSLFQWQFLSRAMFTMIGISINNFFFVILSWNFFGSSKCTINTINLGIAENAKSFVSVINKSDQEWSITFTHIISNIIVASFVTTMTDIQIKKSICKVPGRFLLH